MTLWWCSPSSCPGLTSSAAISSLSYSLGISFGGVPIGTYTWRGRGYLSYRNWSSPRCFVSVGAPSSPFLWSSASWLRRNWVVVGLHFPICLHSEHEAPAHKHYFAVFSQERVGTHTSYGWAPAGQMSLRTHKNMRPSMLGQTSGSSSTVSCLLTVIGARCFRGREQKKAIYREFHPLSSSPSF